MQQAARSDQGQRGVADVNLQQVFEESRIALEDVQGSITHAWQTIHKEHTSGHEGGKKLDAAGGLLVGGKVIAPQCSSEDRGLTEAQGEALAGDGVNRTGGVADESDVAGGDAMEGTTEGDRAAGRAVWFCRDEMALEGGEVLESLFGTDDSLAGDEGDTDFAGRDGCDIGLAVVAPVNLDEAAPGSDGVVLTEAYAPGADSTRAEAGEFGDLGSMSISADEIASAESLRAGVDDGDLLIICYAADRVIPVEANSKTGRAVQQK